ncbi:hypothetical protein [Akkermansia muciniphila]|uniref:hypothetical protein n=1 Tax=Akkermansia muciniphila TaxID=239935 RepID=UPI0029E7F82F|nr:hypothetical protein [Akkermansia muciniphila]WPK65620.1 hypothetical protein SBL66_04975 [Akkermansia muciniphila]
MKNILWLFLFSMLMSPESFGTLASSESDIQTLLSAGRSSFIAGKIREVLRSRLDSGPLTSDKARPIWSCRQKYSFRFLPNLEYQRSEFQSR